MKVYILLEYIEESCNIIDIYFTREAAKERKLREENKYLNTRIASITSFHVIEKTIKGSYGIKFLNEKNKRTLSIYGLTIPF